MEEAFGGHDWLDERTVFAFPMYKIPYMLSTYKVYYSRTFLRDPGGDLNLDLRESTAVECPVLALSLQPSQAWR